MGGSGGTKKKEGTRLDNQQGAFNHSFFPSCLDVTSPPLPPPDVSTLHILFSPLFFLSSISHPEEGLIEFVHVEKQYKTGKYFMAAILYTCQIE